ncbi:MAG: hypothetical protein HY042_05680, partial [Spirochaetia bacterium]|nr:hypothetical protein [Spirochaetia bacterium]
GGALFSSPGTDVGAFAAARYSLSRAWTLQGGGALTRGSVTDFQGIRLPRYALAARSSVEYGAGAWTPFLEYVYFSAPAVKFGELSKPGHELGFGFHYDWPGGVLGWPAARLTAGAVENFLNFGVTPDIGFLFSFEVRG